MSIVEAVMEVDETDIPSVKLGQKANVTVDAYPNHIFTGTVTEVGSSPMSRSGVTTNTEAINFEVKIQLDNPPAGIRPGFSASAEITTGARPQVTAVPIQALVVHDKPGKATGQPATEEGVYMYDAKQQKVKFVPVKTGITGETSIEVVSGVKPGDEIVTGPFRSLREIKDGDKVKIEKPKDGKTAEKS
jgi:HlyD family secretion protein